MELAKSFEPADIEQFWRTEWEQRGYFAASMDDDKPSFSIQLPPPNVTGTLHMGHALNQTVMDGLTRYYRMRHAWARGAHPTQNGRCRQRPFRRAVKRWVIYRNPAP